MVITKALAAGAVGDTDMVLPFKFRVLDVHVIMKGAGVALCTLQVKNGANAITNAMDVSVADTTIVESATIDDAQWDIAAGGTLRITTATGATQPAAYVVIEGIRVA